MVRRLLFIWERELLLQVSMNIGQGHPLITPIRSTWERRGGEEHKKGKCATSYFSFNAKFYLKQFQMWYVNEKFEPRCHMYFIHWRSVVSWWVQMLFTCRSNPTLCSPCDPAGLAPILHMSFIGWKRLLLSLSESPPNLCGSCVCAHDRQVHCQDNQFKSTVLS